MRTAIARIGRTALPGLFLLCVSGALPPSGPGAEPQDFDARVDWVRRNAAPLLTDDPREGLADLDPLRSIVGRARLVALGEGTHGTREFFRMKHRIVQHLVTRMGFTVFSIEANMPEAYRLNEYVLTGKGDPMKLLRGLHFWMWNTQEVLDLIEWMRELNRSGRHRVEFTGFDMQFPDTAMAIARRFVARVDSAELARVDETWNRVRRASQRTPSFIAASRAFPLSEAAGRSVRVSGWIRTEEIEEGWAGLWWRVSGAQGEILIVDNMEGRGPGGTTPWKRYEVNLKVPEHGAEARFGMLMVGRGTAWFDSLSVEIDGRPWSDERVDLDFEIPSSRDAWWSGTQGYESGLDSIVARSGLRSLRLRSTPALRDSQRVAARQVLPAVRSVVARLEGARARYTSIAPVTEVDWAIQSARIVRQCLEVQAGLVSRDECMAKNVDWILAHSPPGTKIALWAHNAHVARQGGSMGGFLAAWHGPDLVSLGFAFHDGRYNAMKNGSLQANDAVPSVPGSAEAVFHATGMPRFLLDLGRVSRSDPKSAWLDGEVDFRSIGSVARDGFHLANIRRQYNGVIYFDRSTPSTLMR